MQMSLSPELRVEVVHVETKTPRIKKFTLACTLGGRLPAWSGGSHIQLTLVDGDRAWRNSYSLTGTPGETRFYEIAVRREDAARSKGGSWLLHTKVQPGDRLTISAPANFFPLARRARKHVLIAGGIGITPFLAHLAALKQSGKAYELHYAYREQAEGAFRQQLSDEHGAYARFYVSEKGNRLSPEAVLARQPLGTHVYVCGPHSLVAAVTDAAFEASWPSAQVHFEEFAPPPIREATPFVVSLPALGLKVKVSAQETLLAALERVGAAIPSSCRVGQCGTCALQVLSGEPDHRDRCLSESEKEGGKIIACVSRCAGEYLALALPK
jgi:ferredoxin-NADP reductase